jgi:ribulose-phosphate 3-epimerase
VRSARRHADATRLQLRLEVDGGITEDTVEQAAAAGADTFVAGTGVYGADDPAAAVRRLRRLAQTGAGRSQGGAGRAQAGAGEPRAGGAEDSG